MAEQTVKDSRLARHLPKIDSQVYQLGLLDIIQAVRAHRPDQQSDPTEFGVWRNMYWPLHFFDGDQTPADAAAELDKSILEQLRDTCDSEFLKGCLGLTIGDAFDDYQARAQSVALLECARSKFVAEEQFWSAFRCLVRIMEFYRSHRKDDELISASKDRVREAGEIRASRNLCSEQAIDSGGTLYAAKCLEIPGEHLQLFVRKKEQSLVESIASEAEAFAAVFDKGMNPNYFHDACNLARSAYAALGKDTEDSRLYDWQARFMERLAGAATSGLVAGMWYSQAVELQTKAGDKASAQALIGKVEQAYQTAQDHEMRAITTRIPISRDTIEAALSLYTGLDTTRILLRMASDANAFPRWTGDPGPQSILREITTPVLISGALPIQTGSDQARESYHLGIQIGAILIEEIFDRFLLPAGPSAMVRLVASSPYASESTKSFALDGIHALFDGRYTETVHIIVPQIEGLLRSILKHKSISTAYRRREGSIMEEDLGGLLRRGDVQSVIGTSLSEWLYTVLAAKEGSNLRNDLCHGLLEYSRCGKTEALLAVFGLLRLAVAR